MKKSLVILNLLFAFGITQAQENIIWKDYNVIFEEKLNDEGVVEYSLHSKEVKYQEVYRLLMITSGSLQEIMWDIMFFENACNEKKGVIKPRGLNQIISRDSKSVFVEVEGESGFAMLEHHELKKLRKVVTNYAIDKGLNLTTNDQEIVSASIDNKHKRK